MKIAVVAGRQFDDENRVKRWFDATVSPLLKKKTSLTFLLGDSPGVDRLIQKLCDNHNIDYVIFKPHHLLDPKTQFQPRFFFIRTRQIIYNCDLLVLFDDKQDNSVQWAEEMGNKIQKEVIKVEKESE